MRKSNSPVPYPLLWLLLAALALSACSNVEQQGAEATPTAIPTPRVSTRPTYTVQRGDVIQQFEATGRFVPASQEQLSFRTSGRVDQLLVSEGDEVTEGQLLAALDTGPSQFDLQRAQANLEIAQLRLEQSRLELLPDSPTYTTTLAIHEKEVELAQIDLDELNTAVSAGQILSPIAGTVLDIAVQEGDQVEAFTPAVSVANTADLEISADLRREQVALATPGLVVEVTPQSGGGQATTGTVTAVLSGSESGSTQGNPAMRIQIEGDPVELGYQLGDSVRLNLVVAKKEAVLWLPPQAVRNFEGRTFVLVDEEGVQRRADVKVGIQSDERLEIVSGLEEGQVVVAP